MKRITPLIAAAAILFATADASAKVRYEVCLTPQGAVAYVSNSYGRMMPPPPPPAPCNHHRCKPSKKQLKQYKKYIKQQKKLAKKQAKLAREMAKHHHCHHPHH